MVEPKIDASEIAGRDRTPGQCRPWYGLADSSFGIEKVDGGKADDPVAGDPELALPKRFAATTPILRTLPHHPYSSAEIGCSERTDCPSDLNAMHNVQSLDRRRTDHLGCQMHRDVTWADDVAHQRQR